MLALVASYSLYGVTLIDPAGDGGFENGATFPANGWTVVNHTTNNWYVGIPGANAGTNGAYISNDGGTTNAYTLTSAQTSHFYRDITLPTTDVGVLTFSWKGGGESTYDRLLVYIAPQTVTPVAGTPVSNSTTLEGATLLGMFNLQTTWQSASVSLMGYTGAQRLIFTWQNDTSLGSQPPISIDNISLTTYTPTPLTGIKTIGPSGTYPSFTEAIADLNQNGVGAGGVTFNVANGTYMENPPAITASGSAANPIIFQSPGGSTVLSPAGGANSYGFKLDGADYITFDGIDVTGDATLVYGYWMINGTSNNTISNSIITMPYGSTSNYAIRCFGTNHNNTFDSNTIASNTYYGIYVYGVSGAEAQNNVVSNNIISGIRNYGIYNNYATGTIISGNTVSGMEANTNAVYAIYSASSTASADIFDNEITGISTSSTVYSLYVTGGTTYNIYSNKIHNLEYTGTSSSIAYGIYISGGTTLNIYNNMVYDVRSPSGTSAPQVRAIAITGGTTVNLWNNSVYLNASGSAGGFATAALYVSSTTPTIDLKNNIFVNKSTPGGTGRTVAFWKTSAGVGTLTPSSDKNIYYAGEPDATHLIGYFSTTGYQTLEDYKTMAATKDQGSYTEDVPFVSSTRIIDLHIDPTITTRVEGNAIPIATVTHDIDGDIREATPDIGADEGEFTAPAGAPGLVTLLAPVDEAQGINPITGVLTWSAPSAGGAVSEYWIYVATDISTIFDESFSTVAAPNTSLVLADVQGLTLGFGETYYWAVQAHNNTGESDPDDPAFQIWSFSTCDQMAANNTLPLGNIWPEDVMNGTIQVQNLGTTSLVFTATGSPEFAFGPLRYSIPPSGSVDLPYTFTVPATLGDYTGSITLEQTEPGLSTIIIGVTGHVTTDVVVGTGTTELNIPVDPYFGYSYSQSIYYPSELNYPDGYRIEKLYYYFNGYETAVDTKDFVIYMAHTTESTFASTTSWLPIAGFTQVYNHTNIPQLQAGGYWMEFVLDTPFIYNGTDNLVIAVEENASGYDSSSSYFYCTGTTGINRSIRYTNDSTNPDPNNPPTGILVAGHPNTKFFVAPIPVNPVISVNPDTWDFGTVVIDTPHSREITIQNNGGGTLTINSITPTTDGFFSLTNLPTFPVNLTSGQTTTFSVNYLPTAAGAHTATFNINDNRAIFPLVVNGTCVDPRITALPFSEYFDSVTAPALPLGWTPYINSTSTSAVVATYNSTTYAQSAPNSVRLYNPSDASADLRLITPQIMVPMNTIRLKFYARSTSAGYPLLVGTVSALDGTGVFTQLASINLTTTKTEYTVLYTGYEGTDQYICFKHGLGGTGRSLYVDNVVMDGLFPADLAATQIGGPGIGSATNQLSYVVTVLNNGTATQNNYTVNLLGSARELLSSVNITTPLDPGMTAQHTLNWTPSAAGSWNLSGQVVVAGDGYAGNDLSQNLPVTIYPNTYYTPLVGDPQSTTTVNYTPFNVYYRNNVAETIYLAHEMQATSGTIQAIVYFNNFTQELDKPVKVWMKNTTEANVATSWLPFDGYTLVYDGMVHFPLGVNAIVLPLIAPFNYTGGNLAIRTNRVWEDTYWNTTNHWYYTASTEYPSRTRYFSEDGAVALDPILLLDEDGVAITGTLVNNIPNIQFVMSSATPITELATPVVTITTNAGNAVLDWPVVPGAYGYRIYASDDPYSWPAEPLAVTHINTYTATAVAKKFYKVVAISSYRNSSHGLITDPATLIGVDNKTIKAEPLIPNRDQKQ